MPAVRQVKGGKSAFIAIAAASASFAREIGELADRAAAVEGRQAGLAFGAQALLPDGIGGELRPISASSDAESIVDVAQQLGVDPLDLATMVSYETGGTFSPAIRGGKDNQHIGLIQFGEAEQKTFGAHQGQSFIEQMGPVGSYLKARKVTPGMGLLDLYSTVNAGAPGLYTRSDGPGATVQSHVDAMQSGEHRLNAERFLAGAVTAQATSAAPLHIIEPDTAPTFQRTGGFTIRGRAFDRAAGAVYSDRLDLQIRTDIEQLARKHEGAPDDLTLAIDSYTAGLVDGVADTPDEIAAVSLANRLKFAAVRAASNEFDKDRRDGARASFNDTYAAMRTSLIRTAMTAGEDDDANEVIAAELAGVEAFIDSQEDLSAQERQKLTTGLTQDVFQARIIGRFDRTESAIGRVEFQSEFEKAFAAGTGDAANLTPESFRKINATLQQQLRADETQAAREFTLLKRQADQMMSRVKAGFLLPPDELTDLKSRAATSGDPVLGDVVDFLDQVVTWQSVNRQSRPADIGAQIEVMQAHMDEKGATPRAVEMLLVMQGLQKSIERGLKNDPLGHAERVGLGEVPPLDMSSGESLTISLINRAAFADQVAAHFRQAPQFFEPGDVETLQRLFKTSPESLPVFAASLAEAFGTRDTGAALKEISKTAPLIGHAAGVAVATGNDAVLAETAQAIANRGIDGFNPVTLTPARQRIMTFQVAGAALQMLPDLEAAAMQQAGLLFENRAHSRNIDPEAENDAIVTLWDGALQDALGRHEVDGEKRGGVDEINNHQTIIPPEMSADTLQGMVDNITQGDLDALTDFVTANDKPIGLSRIRRGKLVAAGHGQYFVALGDPQSVDPQWIQAPDGQPWVLDVFTLSAVQQMHRGSFDRAPQLFR